MLVFSGSFLKNIYFYRIDYREIIFLYHNSCSYGSTSVLRFILGSFQVLLELSIVLNGMAR